MCEFRLRFLKKKRKKKEKIKRLQNDVVLKYIYIKCILNFIINTIQILILLALNVSKLGNNAKSQFSTFLSQFFETIHI